MTTEQLVETLKKASLDYYNEGTSELTDAEYDAFVDLLRQKEPAHEFLKSVGAPPISSGELVKHPKPMGSQEKLKTRAEFEDWMRKMMWEDPSPGPEGTRVQATAFVMEEKLDGITLACYYKDGKLTAAVTRGDGYYGEDITANVVKMKNVKRQLPIKFSGVLRAELILRIPLFERYFKPLGYRNPRNTVAGMSRDKKGNDLVKHFEPFFFQMLPDNEEETVEQHIASGTMKSWGLATALTELFTFVNDGTNAEADFLDRVWSAYEAYATARSTLDHEIDGVIIKVDDADLNAELGMSSDLRPKGERCVKFQALGGVTELISVELTLGHTGAIIPTAKLAPLEIGGVTITSALLNNYEEIERLDVAVGDKVRVIRAGDVIPKIIGVAEKAEYRVPIVPPTECISCGSKLVKDGAHIFCKNEDCEGRAMQRLKSWITKRDIKFIGDTLLEELYVRQGVKEPQDLYKLTEEKIAVMPRGITIYRCPKCKFEGDAEAQTKHHQKSDI